MDADYPAVDDVIRSVLLAGALLMVSSVLGFFRCHRHETIPFVWSGGDDNDGTHAETEEPWPESAKPFGKQG